MVEQIAMKTGLTQKKVSEVLDTFCDLTGNALKQGDIVRIVGFGTLGTKKRSARIVKNPFTKEQIHIPESIVPTFKAGEKLKKKVNSK